MNILVVNDDGIRSPGIAHLVRALSERADVYVAAPEGQRSGASQAITISEEIFVRPVEFPCAEAAYEVAGTPADCTKIGLQFFGEQGIAMDMVYSGINFGSNLGMDTLYSGTVGAAMEGALTGVHSVAVSVDSHEARHFDVACELALDVMSFVRTKTSPATVLNINVPDQPREKIKGIRFTRLGGRYYRDIFVPSEGGGYKMEGAPDAVADDRKLLDVTALAEGYASITPLAVDNTRLDMMTPLAEAGFGIRRRAEMSSGRTLKSSSEVSAGSAAE